MQHAPHRRRQVLGNGLAVRRAIRQQVDLRIIHLFRKAIEKAAEEISEFQTIGCVAERVARRRALAEVVIGGAQAVHGIAEKAQVEKDVAGRGRNGIVNLVAGQRLHAGVRVQIGENVGLLDSPVAIGRIEPRETLAEVAVENVLDRGARVLQDVIVQNDEAQRYVLRPRSVLKDLVARQFDAGFAGRDGIAFDLLQAILMEPEHLLQARIEDPDIRDAHGGVFL